MSKFKECLEKGLLRRIFPSSSKAEKSIKKANRWLREARKNFRFGLWDSCLVSSYAAMFHAARALLFKDGFREKSHFCIARYLEERYVKRGKLERIWVDLLDRFRELRREDLYELEFFATRQDAREAIENAEKFIKTIAKLV